MAQFARPDSIITANSWTGAATAIDESTPSDADFIFSPNNPNSSVEIGLSNVTDPQSSTGHTLRVRLTQGDADGSTPDAGGTATQYGIALYQGITLIAQTTAVGTTSPTTWTTISTTLSGAQADAITDYTDLRVQVNATGGAGNPANRRNVAVSWVELEVPDAPANNNYQQSVSGSLSFAGATVKQARRALAASLGFAGSLVKRTSKALTASVGPSGSVTKSTARSSSGAVTFTATTVKQTGRSTTATVTFTTAFNAELQVEGTPALVIIHIHTE